MGDQQVVEKEAAERHLETLPPPGKVSHWCQTQNEVINVDFEWSIQGTSFLEAYENCGFYSSHFFNEKTSAPKWQLNLYGTGSEINIRLTSLHPQQIVNSFVKVKMAISNKKREKIFPQQHRLPQYTKLPFVVYQIKKEVLFGSECLVNGKLTIYCEIEQYNVSATPKNGKGKVKAEECQQEKPFSDPLADQLEELFENKKYSDIAINVRGREFQAHKIILASRSSVFAAMFDHPTKENLTNRVEIKDVDPDVFYEILRYIYTGRLSEATMEKMPVEILAVADKYLLDQLKMECETQLIHRMTAENCLQMLLLTDEHHPAFYLKKYAGNFFLRFSGEVMATDGWEKIEKEHPELCCGLLKVLVKSFV